MWGAKFFEYGFSAEYIEHMNYWDYIELIEGTSLLNRASSKGGKKYFASSNGELSDTHKQLIKNRNKK